MIRWARVLAGAVVETSERESHPYGPGRESVDHLTKGRWLPVVIDGAVYNPQVQTRSAAVLVVDVDRVIERYTIADRPIAETRAELTRLVKDDARRLLSPTDWYVIRFAETTRLIPQAVRDRRAAIRAASDAFEGEIGAADLATLATYDWGPRWPA